MVSQVRSTECKAMIAVDGLGKEKSCRRSVLEIFSTAPQAAGHRADNYLRHVRDVARWSEEAGCTGILVYTDNSTADPWLVSQMIIAATESLSPLVAVQPVYAHPYTVAKSVASLAFLHGRRIHLNMVAGGFTNDLIALNDPTPHDKRYDRLIEYALIIKKLLAGEAVTYGGDFYTVRQLALKPRLPAELFPGIFVSGSSPAGLAAGTTIGATAVQYPGPVEEIKVGKNGSVDFAARVGIIARATEDEAWRVGFERFPQDRRGQLTHELAMKVSDSQWHAQLSRTQEIGRESAYWLGPFHYAKTNCPYLVGDYEQVGEYLDRYISAGYRKFILDIPDSRQELEHIGIVFEKVRQNLP